MFFLLVSLLSFLLLISKPLPLQLPSWARELSLLSLLLSQELLAHSIQWLRGYKSVCTKILKFSSAMFKSNETESRSVNVAAVAAENEAEEAAMTVLDLPELALDMVLEKLSPAGLLNMANVCTSLRDRCRSDHLWERHFSEKWGRVIGESARKEWESRVIPMRERRRNETVRKETLSCVCVWPCFWFWSRPGCPQSQGESRLMPDYSVMAWYLALDSGRFRFPGQVYNREYGHVGFMLSCYDAELSYDHLTDTFRARYPPHGQRATNIEEGVGWERVRAPPVDTPAHDLHTSDCLHDLRPGDHIEIQWRRTKEFPFGWWYGVVGHLESCDGDEHHHCRCYSSDTVILEFNQYSLGSRWRRAAVDRKDHREEGNESDGFYGGIRKLCDKNEISTWRRLWPTDVLK